jgi:hypothetical protein
VEICKVNPSRRGTSRRRRQYTIIEQVKRGELLSAHRDEFLHLSRMPESVPSRWPGASRRQTEQSTTANFSHIPRDDPPHHENANVAAVNIISIIVIGKPKLNSLRPGFVWFLLGLEKPNGTAHHVGFSTDRLGQGCYSNFPGKKATTAKRGPLGSNLNPFWSLI